MTGGQEKKVRIFDLQRPDAEPDFLSAGSATAHDGTVKSVVWVNHSTAVSAGEDGVVKCVASFGPANGITEGFSFFRWWDIRSNAPISTLQCSGAVTSMELSNATSTLVLTSGQTVSFVPALPSSKPAHKVNLSYAPSSASLHPILGDRFVAGSTADQWVRIHGMNGEEREVLKGHHGPVHCVEFSPDGEMYASGSGKWALLNLLSITDFIPQRTASQRHCQIVKLLTFFPVGTIRLWQTTPGKSYGLWQGTNGM